MQSGSADQRLTFLLIICASYPRKRRSLPLPNAHCGAWQVMNASVRGIWSGDCRRAVPEGKTLVMAVRLDEEEGIKT